MSSTMLGAETNKERHLPACLGGKPQSPPDLPKDTIFRTHKLKGKRFHWAPCFKGLRPGHPIPRQKHGRHYKERHFVMARKPSKKEQQRKLSAGQKIEAKATSLGNTPKNASSSPRQLQSQSSWHHADEPPRDKAQPPHIRHDVILQPLCALSKFSHL